MSKTTTALLAILLLAGCQAPKTLYYWGNYEAITYLSYVKPEKATLQIQMEKLQEDVRQAAKAHLPVNPGLHAQLGYLYAQLGQLDSAREEFELEKSLFPESAPFIDQMLQRIKRPTS